MTTSKPTKKGMLSQEFTRAAAEDPSGALAYMLMSAFGVSLARCMEVCARLLVAENKAAIIMCLTAAVQIRANVTFVGRDFAGIRLGAPELIIEGERQTGDVYNFGALHACGHIFANMVVHGTGKNILAKAGDCVRGTGFTDNEAGQINAEIFKAWTQEDKQALNVWLSDNIAAHGPKIEAIFTSLSSLQANFALKLAGRTVPPPGASAAKKPDVPPPPGSGKA